MNEKAEELAHGRWPDILMARGLDSSFFNGRSGPCPFCGGKDRFRWAQNKFGGVWVCNQCTSGKYADGFKLLMRHMGYTSFRDAADDVREFFGTSSTIKPIPREQRASYSNDWTPEKVAHNRERMLKFWNQAQAISAGDPVDLYMQNRVPGMDLVLHELRFHPALEYWAPPTELDGKPIFLGKYPAMLAIARDADGQIAQLHKTYLTPDGQKANVPIPKKTDLGVGVNSFAVRMMVPVGDTLGICEGLETGWASAMLKGVPVWPCLNGPALAKFELPLELVATIKKLIIFADSDELKMAGTTPAGYAAMRRPGSAYAEICAENARKKRLRCLIVRPAKTGDDFADYWKEKVAA
jgi:putative DNA primase/helicase